ncbi:MAG TPA: hypothetical protein PKI27_03365 [Dermatophilaceae bacterium]|nr:hypothetical protein [Dermatophilaceae bacterium]HOA01329.1 hypothetical protein [Dermatophilaceae bacterium]
MTSPGTPPPSQRRRRAPRLVPFIATGAILGYVVGLLLAARPVAAEAAQRLQNYSFNSQAGYLGLFGALMGALLGAVVFVVLDRRS